MRHGGRAAVVVLVLALAVAGCGGPSEKELAAAREAEQERVLDGIEDAPVWIGTVLAFEDTLYDPITFDYGGRYETSIDVARIAPLRDCDPERDRADTQAFTAFLRDRAPVGTRLALVRSEDEFGTRDSEGFLRRLRPDGTPDTDRPTINEEMVAAGVAVPEPAVTLRRPYDRTFRPDVDREIAERRAEMSAVDFENWNAFVRAYLVADERRVGPAGACAEYQVRREREADESRRRSEEDYRRMELGPDGRRGTADDFTDPDLDGEPGVRGGGSGGDGFDFPDSLCPTRFC